MKDFEKWLTVGLAVAILSVLGLSSLVNGLDAYYTARGQYEINTAVADQVRAVTGILRTLTLLAGVLAGLVVLLLGLALAGAVYLGWRAIQRQREPVALSLPYTVRRLRQPRSTQPRLSYDDVPLVIYGAVEEADRWAR